VLKTPKFLVRAEGLGEVRALFFYRATTPEEVLQDIQIIRKSFGSKNPDFREVYEIEEIDLTSVENGRVGLSVYLHTGIPIKKEKDRRNVFFTAESDAEAKRTALAPGWEDENRLYRCSLVEFD